MSDAPAGPDRAAGTAADGSRRRSTHITPWERAAVIAIAGWSGFFVMSVELLSGRILAPYFGNSIYVWGGVITVFMLGLSIGYLLGGQWSVHAPSRRRLAMLQLCAAALLVPVLVAGQPVLDRLFDAIEDPRWGSIAGSAVLFLVPTILSGMVSPYAVRLLVADSRTSGRLSGLLFFFSTFGSAAGTLLTSFYLVLVLEIDQILLALVAGSVLVSGSVLWFGRARASGRHAVAVLAMLTAALAATVPSPANADPAVLHREKSLYRDILVTESRAERCMIFSMRRSATNRQSCIFTDAPDRLVLDYTKLMLAGLYVQPRAQRVLVIGLGGGVLPRTVTKLLPDATVDVVEIDAAVVEVARRWFRYAAGPGTRVRSTVQDGRVFVKRAARAGTKYDLVFLDAYDHEYIPEHLLTLEFLREVRAILAHDGVVVANTFSRSRLYDSESATYAAAFGTFLEFKAMNRIIVAANHALPTADALHRAAARWDVAFRPLGTSSREILSHRVEKPRWRARARVLTDQYSPSNLLNARCRADGLGVC